MPKFIQIKNVAIAVDEIASVHFNHEQKVVSVFTTSSLEDSNWIDFRFDDYEAFFKWWSNRDDVEVLN